MNPDEKLDVLLRAARESAPDTSRAEHAFETRFAARLRAEYGESWFAWAWRLSPFLAALVVASAVWCRTSTSIDTDTDALLDAVRNSGGAPMLAWWPEEER
jgi:hypothetical protein